MHSKECNNKVQDESPYKTDVRRSVSYNSLIADLVSVVSINQSRRLARAALGPGQRTVTSQQVMLVKVSWSSQVMDGLSRLSIQLTTAAGVESVRVGLTLS